MDTAKPGLIANTPNTPYPTNLPINFPDVAMYLHSAVEDSRKMVHDDSSGVKRLAKTLDPQCPTTEDTRDLPDSRHRKSLGATLRPTHEITLAWTPLWLRRLIASEAGPAVIMAGCRAITTGRDYAPPRATERLRVGETLNLL